jgi:hypothetical protein
LTVLCVLELVLVACGIDQGGVRIPPTVNSGTLVVSGPITGFGSVLVNGLTLSTNGTEVLIDGKLASEADLRVGQIIRAIVRRDATGTRALLIEHEENLVGPVEAIDSANGTVTVLGQTVLIDSATRFDIPQALGIADLQITERIVVSGFPISAGELRATYIRRAGPTELFQITASISGLDIPGLIFGLGNLLIDYSQVAVLQIPNGMPAINLVVEVRGSVLAGGKLVAEEIRQLPLIPGLFDAAATALTPSETPIVGAAATSAVLEANFIGFISSENLPGRISLGDVDVLLDSGTIIVGGTVDDLSIADLIQVEGDISTFGQIQADRIRVF